VLRRIDGLEKRIESLFSVDEEPRAVASNDGQSRHGLECAKIGGERIVVGGVRPIASMIVEERTACPPRPCS
jgi:hypothetical protein